MSQRRSIRSRQLVLIAFIGGLTIAFSEFLLAPLFFALNYPLYYVRLLKGIGEFSGVATITFAIIQFYLDFGSISLRTFVLGPVKLSSSPPELISPVSHPAGQNEVKTARPPGELDGDEGDETPSFDQPSLLAARMVSRLEEEIELQSRRANTNLGLGITAALTGLAILGWLSMLTASELQFSVEHTVRDVNGMLYWGSFSSRLALSIAANIFAFFFFASYRRNLSEVRYFHNELTNIQARVVAVGLTNTTGPAEMRKMAIRSLLDVERNFVLRKGETTAEVAMREHDRDDITALSQLLSNLTQITPIQNVNTPNSSVRGGARKSKI